MVIIGGGSHGLALYELSMKLWERLERELNFNVMVSQCGLLNLCHSDASEMLSPDAATRCG